jgi:hypothetical protein
VDKKRISREKAVFMGKQLVSRKFGTSVDKEPEFKVGINTNKYFILCLHLIIAVSAPMHYFFTVGRRADNSQLVLDSTNSEGVISFSNPVISFGNPALMFHLLLQPFVQKADDDNASWSRQGRGRVQTNPDSTFAMSVWATKIWQQFLPARQNRY